MKKIVSCGFAVLVCALSAHAQLSGEVIGDKVVVIDGEADATFESRTPLNPPGEGEMLPAAASIEINAPGSYVLTGNIIGVAGLHGIEINTSNVTIDLNGFALVGKPGALSGIHAENGVVNVKIHNGAIRGWPIRGVSGQKMTSSEVSDLRVGNCGNDGIRFGQGLVSNCTSRANGAMGINITKGKSVVRGCAVELNGTTGVDLASFSSASDISSTGNGGVGIYAGGSCTLSACVAVENELEGIHCASNCTIERSTSESNLGQGFFCEAMTSIVNCTARDNSDVGISVTSGLVDGCVSNDNLIGGIYANYASLVRGCSVRGHEGDNEYGIRMGYDNAVVGNMCDSNYYGIYGTGEDCRIDGNDITDGSTGIRLVLGGNIVVRNTISGMNSVASLAPGNMPAVFSTDPTVAGPWANFSY